MSKYLEYWLYLPVVTKLFHNKYHLDIHRPIRVIVLVGLLLFQFITRCIAQSPKVEIIILGIAQDAGYPQVGCRSSCCAPAWADPDLRRSPVCLGIIDHTASKSWLVEATPDLKYQWQAFTEMTGADPEGILITHAHAGHYTGLMQLGREMMNTNQMPVYVLPRMAQFLSLNGPWNQLVAIQNITINEILPDSLFNLSPNLQCQAILVPHRDEYSETAAFIFTGPSKKLLFIPDIDKWSKWDRNILHLIQTVDFALIDGTFFQDGELKNRAMSEIPHPFVSESISLFESLPLRDRQKVYFIHFNHTNPLVRGGEKAWEQVVATGMNIASQELKISL